MNEEILSIWPSLTANQQSAILDIARKMLRPVQSEWLTVSKACSEYNQSARTVYLAIQKGELDARIPYGKTRGYRVRRSDFESWLGLCS